MLRERRARGQITALLIDEAQSLSGELLEEIRLLANSETVDREAAAPRAGRSAGIARPAERERAAAAEAARHAALRDPPFTLQETAAYIA